MLLATDTVLSVETVPLLPDTLSVLGAPEGGVEGTAVGEVAVLLSGDTLSVGTLVGEEDGTGDQGTEVLVVATGVVAAEDEAHGTGAVLGRAVLHTLFALQVGTHDPLPRGTPLQDLLAHLSTPHT